MTNRRVMLLALSVFRADILLRYESSDAGEDGEEDEEDDEEEEAEDEEAAPEEEKAGNSRALTFQLLPQLI